MERKRNDASAMAPFHGAQRSAVDGIPHNDGGLPLQPFGSDLSRGDESTAFTHGEAQDVVVVACSSERNK